MGFIHVLPDLLVNRIAAGEVIERPASVVKELVENSIDAEATRIDITIEEGGQRLIRITDDGMGMDVDDLTLSIVPHATSKIEREQDLFAIGTMGFRGEALASIASVSELRITSRRRDSDSGHEIRVTGAEVDGPKAVGSPIGTTIEVRDLFFNVPARRKFLRTAQTEFGHIVEQLARIALAHPRIEFRLTHNGREVHRLPATDSLRTRIADFYGAELAESLIAIEREQRGLTLSGLVAPPAHSRSTGRWEYAFVNGRFIRDKFVQHAVREAYRGLIDPNRFPVTFLKIRVEPSDVDVNVHPTKIEVRWRDSNAIHSLVLSAMRDTFLGRDLTSELKTDGRTDNDPESRRQQIRQAMADFFKNNAPPPAAEPTLYSGSTHTPTPTSPSLPRGGGTPQRSSVYSQEIAGGASRTVPPYEGDHASVPPYQGGIKGGGIPDPGRSTPAFAVNDLGRVQDDLHLAASAEHVLQVHNAYLVAETADGIVIIDQHALHERILYEQLRSDVSAGALESQRLLLPITINVSGDQMAVLESHADLLHQLGFEATAFGRSAVAIHACPSMLKDHQAEAFVRDMFEKLAAGTVDASPEAVLEDMLQMMACKAAIKAGDPLAPKEIESLLALREQADRTSNCPHGRPTTLRLTLSDLERQFKRT